MLSFAIHELQTIGEMLKYMEILRFLNPHINKTEYEDMLKKMIPYGYGQVIVLGNNNCIGLSGFWISTKLYSGKYLEMDNVVVHENYRSQGIGKLLCDWCIEKAKAENCKYVMLDAYLENEKAHKFYEREGFTKRGFHFMRKL